LVLRGSPRDLEAAVVKDDDIQELIETDEAGVGDLLDRYAAAEEAYMAATTHAAPADAYSTVTWAADSSSVGDSAR
jgi:hypothetical protein